MTSKEAFEKIIELCNYYQHTIEKDTEIGTIWGYPIDNIRKDLEILEKYKSIEDILGIDLITLFNIDKQLNTKKEIWFKIGDEIDASYRYDGDYYIVDFKHKAFVKMVCEPIDYFYFKDYGKTWALTKEELENDN